ncbi:putative bifunctional diguanylate cyclase/phosphodiesterase [Cryptosporangium sp. NPDC048952]|uniref:putative bifunctional diguanylate cyclase/phosphodiesterase n=1 Tax=Cryptosporangium sp. NPDC048952 TaxID=3363961 RepID=UPI00371F6318
MRGRWWAWIAAAVGFVVFAVVGPVLGPLHEPVEDALIVALIGWAMLRFLRSGRHVLGRIRVGRQFGALGMGFWLVALVWHAVTERLDLSVSFRALTLTAFVMPAAICVAIAMLALPVAPPTVMGKLRLVCDGSIIAFSLSALVWLFIGDDWYATPDSAFGDVSVAVLCLTLMTVVAMVILLLIYGQVAWRSAFTGLAVGAAMLSTSIVLQLIAVLRETEWNWGHAVAQLGLLAIAWSAGRRTDSVHVRDHGASLLAQAWSYLPLLVLVIFLIRQQTTAGRIDPVVLWHEIGVVVAVVGRQFLTLRMTASLTTELGAQRERFAHQAFHDPLTGLANRALFGERLEEALAGRPALLLIDLDGFKAVNDTRGHGAGDQLLVAVAGRLRGAVRATDTVARLGGDEFAVLLPGASASADATGVATVILERIAEPVALGEGTPVSVRASVGIALADGSATAETLLRDADLALYEAKESGKNRYRVADPELSSSTLGRLRLEEELRVALEVGEFEVHYQPIVELASERITAVEALLRWRHPTRGLLGPGAFLETAESVGLLPALDGFVLRTACAQVRTWRASRPEFVVSVNVCAAHLVDPGLVDEVAAALAAADVPPSALMLEVTETALVADLAMAAQTLRELSSLGVRIALDDFGTGYSSLTYLRTLPIHAIKIDRSFVRDLDGNATDEAVTRAILGLAETLGLRPVAEGVEGVSQADRLRDLRCGHAQGFLFAKPMPAEELTELLGAPVRA